MESRTDALQAAPGASYTLERELGRGGMATVYLARDVRHRRSVAVKVLHPELSAVIGPGRFLCEIELTASLQHPHILPLFDSGLVPTSAGDTGGHPYYVMPYVEGETLRTRLERERQLPVDDAVRLGVPVHGRPLGLGHLASASGWLPGAPVPRHPAKESGGVLSPDGRWVAYTSDESGRNAVYVQSFPKPGLKTLVSGRGINPVWGREGLNLYYWEGTSSSWRASRPKVSAGRSR